MTDEQPKKELKPPTPLEPKPVSVVLKQNHEHGGEKYKAGDTIEVNEADAKWLKDNGVI